MPELPEVEIVRLGLSACLPGTKIESVELFPGHTVKYPTAAKFFSGLVGCTFERVERRGKYLLFQMADGKCLVVHLGMSGRLLLVGSGIRHRPAGVPSGKLTHIRMQIGFSGGGKVMDKNSKPTRRSCLYLQDPRRFSRVWLADNQAKLYVIVPSLMQLGVEPLSDQLDEEYLRTRFCKRKQSIKAVLLDQTVIAGIGNIYADELLFVARIHPLTSVQKLTPALRQRLIDAARNVLARAIKKGGSTLRNYTDADGTNGKYQLKAWVYARAGQPCRVCATTIRKVVVMARSTHFCPNCQRMRVA